MKHEALRYAHDEGHTDVCFSSDGSKFITCGADGDIRIWSIKENEDPIHNCVGEWALSIAQKGDNLYVSTGSNDIQILTFPDGERNGVLDRFVAPINQIVTGKNTHHVALAGADMEVKLIHIQESGEKDVSIFDGLGGPCLSVALCPHSKFIAASSGDGKLRVWNVEDKQLLTEVDCFPKANSFSNVKVLCRLDFEPIHGRLLAYPENDTVVLLNTSDWAQQATLSSSQITGSYSLVRFSPCGKYIAATSIEGDFVIYDISTEEMMSRSKHSKSIPICGLVWNPLSNGQIVYTDIEGQLGIISNCIEIAPNRPASTTNEKETSFEEHDVDFGSVNFEDDDDEDNENAVSVEKLKRQYMGNDDDEPELNFGGGSPAPTPRPRTPEIPLQPPFMPSSTPEHLNPRYLCWNEIGIIRSYGAADDDSGKSIEIEFHDSSFHNSMMLQNYQDYVMGSIGSSALVVANANQIQVIPLSASSKEWTLKVEEYEEIVLVAASEHLICLATNNYLVRVCSIFGTQRGIVSIPGPVVSMAAYQNFLLVAYHMAGVRKGDQTINIKLIKFENFAVQSVDITSALGPDSKLFWLGFTDLGTPAMMDSLGMLSLFPRHCNIWVPFCDTTKHRKSPADGFFVTAIFEAYQNVAGIKCKGTAYPGFTPTPTVCELPLEPPFAESGTEKTQMEMNLFAWSNLQVNDVEKKIKETGLKTFALACRSNLDQRALELMEILSNPQILTLSVKYALKLERRRLAEKLMELASKITENISEDSSGPSQELDPNTSDTYSKSFSKKLSLSSRKLTPRNKIGRKENEEITQEANTTANSTLNNTMDDSIARTPVSQPVQRNPFLKSLKQVDTPPNPLSLTNKFAGIEYNDTKDKKTKNSEVAEKRKQPDSDIDKPKEKQRKLDRFMFTKRS